MSGEHRYFIIRPRETNFRSFAWSAQRLGMFTHRDLALNWNTRQTRLGRVRHSVSFLQTTILHEFGHTLGLHHVGGRGNADSNYGISLEQRKRSPWPGRPWDAELDPTLDIAELRNHRIPTRPEAPRALQATVVATPADKRTGQRLVPPPPPGLRG